PVGNFMHARPFWRGRSRTFQQVGAAAPLQSWRHPRPHRWSPPLSPCRPFGHSARRPRTPDFNGGSGLGEGAVDALRLMTSGGPLPAVLAARTTVIPARGPLGEFAIAP